jgi:hypothetical protein
MPSQSKTTSLFGHLIKKCDCIGNSCHERSKTMYKSRLQIRRMEIKNNKYFNEGSEQFILIRELS